MKRLSLLPLHVAGFAFGSSAAGRSVGRSCAGTTRTGSLQRAALSGLSERKSIDESHASLARDLRILLRERLVQGDTMSEADVAFIVDRYGEYVLLRPAVTGSNWSALGGGSAHVVIAGGVRIGLFPAPIGGGPRLKRLR